MGWAKDHLSEGRRREIASSLFEVTGRDSDRGEMIGRCPAAGGGWFAGLGLNPDYTGPAKERIKAAGLLITQAA